MGPEPRTPVIVGVGQVHRRLADAELDRATEPVDMLADAARRAADDAGPGAALLARVTALRVLRITEWRYADAAGLVADRLGIRPADATVSGLGGNSPQRLLTEAAADVAAGTQDVVLVGGAEAAHSVALARRAGVELPWTPDTPTAADRVDLPLHPVEAAVGLRSVREVFPILDNAIRARHGATIAEHRARIARMWSLYSEVAARNPCAWSPRVRTPEEVATVTADNRMICFPYTKTMNAYARVDQAAAVIVCSWETARALGVPDDRMVFPVAGADCHEHWYVSERHDLGVSAGMRANAAAVLGAAGVSVDDVAHLDLYACFPAPPQLAAEALGVPVDDPARPLTETGGLAFAGGPGNDYMTHAVANLVGALRADPDPGALGFASGVGWFATTHSAWLYATRPPAGGFRRLSPQAEVDAGPRREPVADHDGPVTVETYTVSHDRDGAPERAFVAGLLADGRRAWGTSTDPDLLVALEREELLGAPATVRGGLVTVG